MPGGNCAFPKCTVSRTQNHQGTGIFKIPMRNNEFYTNWRKEIVGVLARYRVMDKTLRERVQEGKISICERHFKQEDIEYTSNVFFSYYFLVYILFWKFSYKNKTKFLTLDFQKFLFLKLL